MGQRKKITRYAIPGSSRAYGVAQRLRCRKAEDRASIDLGAEQRLEFLLVVLVQDGLRIDLMHVRVHRRRGEDEVVLRDRRVLLQQDLLRAVDRTDVVDPVLD